MDENQNQDVVIEGPSEPQVEGEVVTETPEVPTEETPSPVVEEEKVEVVTDEPTVEEQVSEFIATDDGFIQEYTALCEKYNRRINVQPVFIPRDDNTWSITLQTVVTANE